MPDTDDRPGLVRRLRLPALAVVVVLAAAAVGVLGTRDGSSDPPTLHASVRLGADPTPIPAGFLGLSIEFDALPAYIGSDPSDVNPVFEQLVRNLSPGAPQLRIGGNSTDRSYAPAAGVKPPRYVAYALTPTWMATTGALVRQLGAKVILGVNLAANQPALDAAEAHDYEAAVGTDAIEAIEIGNEPNLYHNITVYHTASGAPVRARPTTFGYPAYRSEFRATARAIGSLPLVAPALAAGPDPGPGSWIHVVSNLLSADSGVRDLTVHRYPLRNCSVGPSNPQYPTIAHLLSSYSTVGLAASVQPWLKIADAQHRGLRVDELNSVACLGMTGVSNTFASALWVTDALFSLVKAGVAGVDVHTLPGAAYNLFSFTDRGGRWSGTVNPVYYGLQLFAEAAPAGSELIDLPGAGADGWLSEWATRDRAGTTRVVLIDKSQTRGGRVTIAAPAGDRGPVTVERMLAPSAAATSGVTLGGRSYGTTTTGRLAAPSTQTLTPGRDGRYAVTLPAASAALVTFAAS